MEAGAIDCIVFSRDRAMQLDACLRSLAERVGSLYGRVAVLYCATAPEFTEAYAQLVEEYPDALWRRETEFAEDLRALVTDAPWTVFHTDDDVFFRTPEPPGLEADE